MVKAQLSILEWKTPSMAEESATPNPPEGLPPSEDSAEEKPSPEPAGAGTGEPEAPPSAATEPNNKHWYVVKVQSGREESIKDAIERRVKIEGLQEFFGSERLSQRYHSSRRHGRRSGILVLT